jgi:hypothetical protein
MGLSQSLGADDLNRHGHVGQPLFAALGLYDDFRGRVALVLTDLSVGVVH